MKGKKKSKVKKRIITAAIAVIVLAGAAAMLLRPAPSAYDSITAKAGDITTYYSFSGNIEAKTRQSVSAEKLMQISEIKVKAGDVVKSGDILIKTSTGDEIKAKIDGEVSNIDVSESAQVMPGVKLMDIVNYKDLQAKVKVDEYDLSSISKGKEATVHVDSLNQDFNGTINDISREGITVNGVTYFTATVALKESPDLRVGMSTEVRLQSGHASGVVTLPMSAVQFDDQNKPYVFKGDEKSPTKAEITTGIQDGTTVEITNGISLDETVLVPRKSTAQTGFGPMGRSSRDGGSDQ